jgi:heat shock protein HslJ
MRMCEAELMNQERAFLMMLASTKRFEIQEGDLILVTADGRAIKARRG